MDLQEKIKAVPYWYHRIELPGGIITPGWAPIDPTRYSIPADLTGKRVLDIGAWDGYWTWEALKRGAKEVVAIDDFSDTCGDPKIKRTGWETFDLCREAFGFTMPADSKDVLDIHRYGDRDPNTTIIRHAVAFAPAWRNETGAIVRRVNLSVYEIAEFVLGRFDIIFFFGTIYHLKHPLLALEKIAAICDGALYVETASLDEFSPYRGGLGQGFDHNEMVCEFYPGAEYGNNPSNWWVPTLQCLGAMMASVGFKDIECWPLTENPKDLAQCRGFASGTKDPAKEPANHPADVDAVAPADSARVMAVMSVPRYGPMLNMSCCDQALLPLRIPLIKVQGAFWGQCLERGMQTLIDNGADIVLTIDYDTVFNRADVDGILRLMCLHPEAAAIVPIHVGRGGFKALMSMKTISGQPRKDVPLTELEAETVKIASGHFGLTAFRVKDLLDIPHPWLWDQPNQDHQWGPGRIDADIWFWKQLERAGKTVLSANRIVLGHIEEVISWPDVNFDPIFQRSTDFNDNSKPKNVWK